jgi:hypothetical protein
LSLFVFAMCSHRYAFCNEKIKRWEGHVTHIRNRTGDYRGFVSMREGKKPLEKPGHRWEDINMNF